MSLQAADLTIMIPPEVTATLLRRAAARRDFTPQRATCPPRRRLPLPWRRIAVAAVILMGLPFLCTLAIRAVGEWRWHGDGAAASREEDRAPNCGVQQCFGTTVAFVPTPAEASRLAGTSGKLVFLLHVSGDFDDPGLT